MLIKEIIVSDIPKLQKITQDMSNNFTIYLQKSLNTFYRYRINTTHIDNAHNFIFNSVKNKIINKIKEYVINNNIMKMSLSSYINFRRYFLIFSLINNLCYRSVNLTNIR